MLLILKTVDRVCGDVRKLVVFVRFPVAVGTRSGYLGDNVTDNLYLGLVVGGILDAVTQAVKVIHDCRQTVFGGLLGSVGDSQVILRFGFRFVGALTASLMACRFSTVSNILPSFSSMPSLLRIWLMKVNSLRITVFELEMSVLLPLGNSPLIPSIIWETSFCHGLPVPTSPPNR